MDDIIDQPTLAPITFSIEYGGNITVVGGQGLVTGPYKVTVSGNSVTHATGQSLQPTPADATRLIICRDVGITQCDAYQIRSDLIRIEPANGIRFQEGDPIIIDAAPGSIVSVRVLQPPRGPADIQGKQFLFEEASQETEVNLELSGTTVDLSYDHFSGELKPINGAQVFLYDGDGFGPDKPEDRSDYPGEKDCHDRRDLGNQPQEWQDFFSAEGFKGMLKFSTFCIKTAEGNFGLLFIEPDESKKPVAYDVYSHIWVR